MIYSLLIISYIFLYSCGGPINITKLLDRYPEYDENSDTHKLIIYRSTDEIDSNYKIIAKINLTNSAIYGNLSYDQRIKELLLNKINDIGADALIYKEVESDSLYTIFEVIYFTSDNTID